ncbi:MAG: hypothetical protein [Circular genetic element sp.]|nr:MAG: hypothetical protein [Circular genetic element sp.]
MTKGVSVTSSIITISGQTTELVPGTMEQEQVPLSLDILNREVLLIYAIDMNVQNPDALAGTNTFTEASLSSTSRTTLGRISDTNVMGFASKAIRAGGFVDGGVGFMEVSPETPTANSLDYIGIVSTNDFFVQVQGFQNVGVKQVDWRIWCARAKVTADIYAALVQGETLSA